MTLEIPLRAGPALYPLTPSPTSQHLHLTSKASYIILLHDISQFLRENFTMTQQEYTSLISPNTTTEVPTYTLLDMP